MSGKYGALNCGTTGCGWILFVTLFHCQGEKAIEIFMLSIQHDCLNSLKQTNENLSNVPTAC